MLKPLNETTIQDMDIDIALENDARTALMAHPPDGSNAVHKEVPRNSKLPEYKVVRVIEIQYPVKLIVCIWSSMVWQIQACCPFPL